MVCFAGPYEVPSPSYDAVSMSGVFSVASLQGGPLPLGAPPPLDKLHLPSQHQQQQQVRRSLVGGAMSGALQSRALVGPPHSGNFQC